MQVDEGKVGEYKGKKGKDSRERRNRENDECLYEECVKRKLEM